MARERILQVKVLGDARSVDRMFGSLGKQSQSFSQRMGALGSSLTRKLTLPLIAGAGLAVKELMNVEEANRQTAAALKSTKGAANVTAQEIRALADEMQNLAAVDAEEIQAAENVLLTFTKVRNEVGKNNDIFNQAVRVSADLSARMGQDLKSSIVQVGKALNDPLRGLTALQRVGIQFTEEQKEQIETLVENGETMKAQKIILAELTTEFGGSAKAAGKTLGGQLNKLRFNLEDLGASIVKELMPHIKDLAKWLSDLFARFKNLSPETKKWILIIGGSLIVLGPVISMLKNLWTAITIVRGAMILLTSHPVVAAIAGLAALIILVVKNWDKVKPAIARAFQGVGRFFDMALGPLDELIAKLVRAIELLAQLDVFHSTRNFANDFADAVNGARAGSGGNTSGGKTGGPMTNARVYNFNISADSTTDGNKLARAIREEVSRIEKYNGRVARASLT